MKVVLFWLGLTLAALTVEGRDSMIVSDIPNREPKDIKDNNNNHNNNENNDQPTVHKSNDVYPSRPQHMPPPTSHQHRVATFMHVQNRPANRHLTMRNDLTKPQSSTEELSEGGPAAYEHRFKRVFHHSENSSLPAHSSSINLEILRINLFNESMTQRNDAINRIYCDKTVTEERLALFEECQIKPPKYLQACYNEVYGENWTYSNKRDLICDNRHEFYLRWRRCYYRNLMGAIQNNKDEKMFWRLVRNEEPIRGSISFFKYYESMRNEKLQKLLCQEKALGISYAEQSTHPVHSEMNES